MKLCSESDLTRRQAVLTLLVILAGISLRIYRALTITLWSDEYHTVRLIRLPLERLVTGQYSGDLNPPLYYVLLRIVLMTVGESEIAMRLFSVAFAIGALVLYFLLIREMFPTVSANLAIGGTTLLAFHPLFIFYSTEIRPYSILVFFSLLSLYSYYRLSRRKKLSGFWGVVLVLSLVACPYLHHFGVLTLVTVTAFAGVHLLLRRDVRTQLLVMALVVLAGSLYLPGAVRFLYQQASNYSHASSLFTPAEFLQVFSFSLHSPTYEPLVVWLAILACIVGIAVLSWARESRAVAISIALATTLTVAATLLAYMLDINVVGRYIMHVVPVLFIAMAGPLAIERTRRIGRLTWGLGLVVVLLYGAYAIDFTLHTRSETELVGWKTDWEIVSKEIGQIDATSQPIVLTSWDNTPLRYYLDNLTMTLPEMQAELVDSPRPSYLIVVSENTPALPTLPSSAEITIVYENEQESVQILRLTSAEN